METGGFSFCTEMDGKLAEAEQRKIEYLEARIDYTRPESILRVYDKTIQEQLFKTPVGLMYLKKMQDFLLKQETIPREKIKSIPLYDTYVGGQQDALNAEKLSPQAVRKKEHEKTRFHISLVLNVLLVLAVCAMFVITLTSDQPNIFNYKRALQDRYASWEQDLKAREQAVRDKERELDIDGLDGIQEK